MLLLYFNTLLFSHDVIYFLNFPSSTNSKTAPKYIAATPRLQSWNGVSNLTSKHLDLSNVTMVIMAKQPYFSFTRPQDTPHKMKVFVPMCLWKLQCGFLCFFWSNDFFLSDRHFRQCQYSLHFTVDNDTVLLATASIFISLLTFVVGSISTCQTKTHLSLYTGPTSTRSIWWLDIPIMLLLALKLFKRINTDTSSLLKLFPG